jgi:hypothetical protein
MKCNRLFPVLLVMLCAFSVTAQGVFSKEGQQKKTDTLQKLKITPFVHGTLQTPKDGKANKLVIFIMGSGDVDRDGNQATSRRNTFKKLGNDLAQNGIATFRYDKRVIPMLKQNMDYRNISFKDFIKDAKDAITYFRKDGKYTQIYIAGHSQGSLVGMLAAKDNADGFISIAGPSNTIDEAIVSQLEQQMGMGKEAQYAFNALRKDGRVTDYNKGLASIFNEDLQPFLLSWMPYNPSEEIKKLEMPILIINGTKDLQVTVNDAETLHQAVPKSELKLFENMNHVLVTIEGDDLENAKSYNESWRPLSKGLVETISNFIKQN